MATYSKSGQSTESSYLSRTFNATRRNELRSISTGEEKISKIPDPKLHQFISFVKSGVRIIGYCFIPYSLIVATGVLVISELIGIIEELV